MRSYFSGKNKKKIIILALLIAALGAAYFSNLPGPQNGTPAPSGNAVGAPSDVTASQPLTLPKGKQFFRTSGGGKTGPRITEGFIDPYDPAIGARQTISIEVTDSSPVTKVEVLLKTDNNAETYSLALVEGTAEDGLWQGSWTMSDTYEKNYVAVIRTTSARGTSQIDITLR